MNLVEHVLDELEVTEYQLKEAAQALLHTILFCRAAGPVSPEDTDCEELEITYARCGGSNIEVAVNDAIHRLRASLVPAGPDILRGCLQISFFERRVKRAIFGLMQNEEKLVWERWVLPLVVARVPRAAGLDEAAAVERARTRQDAEQRVRDAILRISAIVNGPVTHIPPVQYEMEITTLTAEGREAVYSRVLQTPSLMSLAQ